MVKKSSEFTKFRFPTPLTKEEKIAKADIDNAYKLTGWYKLMVENKPFGLLSTFDQLDIVDDQRSPEDFFNLPSIQVTIPKEILVDHRIFEYKFLVDTQSCLKEVIPNLKQLPTHICRISPSTVFSFTEVLDFPDQIKYRLYADLRSRLRSTVKFSIENPKYIFEDGYLYLKCQLTTSIFEIIMSFVTQEFLCYSDFDGSIKIRILKSETDLSHCCNILSFISELSAHFGMFDFSVYKNKLITFDLPCDEEMLGDLGLSIDGIGFDQQELSTVTADVDQSQVIHLTCGQDDRKRINEPVSTPDDDEIDSPGLDLSILSFDQIDEML